MSAGRFAQCRHANTNKSILWCPKAAYATCLHASPGSKPGVLTNA